MRKSHLNKIFTTNLGVSLEDNSQVEVNFNIDTDEDGAPTPEEDVEIDEQSEPEEDALDEEPSEETDSKEVDDAEAEMEEMQEAQDSLESLGDNLIQQVNSGNVTPALLSMYQVALESIVKGRVATPSLENFRESKNHAVLVALESHEVIQEQIATISLEARMDFMKKMGHRFNVWVRKEKALASRATKLRSIAEGKDRADNANKEIQANSKKGVKLPTLLVRKWTSEKEFIVNIKEFTSLYDGMAEMRNTGYENDFAENMFPNMRKWKKNEDGKPQLDTFGMRVLYDKAIVASPAIPVKEEVSIPRLSPETCSIVLDLLNETLTKGNMVKGNVEKMVKIANTNKVGATKATRKDWANAAAHHVIATKVPLVGKPRMPKSKNGTVRLEHSDMIKALGIMMSVKNRAITEILNYINYSLTDNDFKS